MPTKLPPSPGSAEADKRMKALIDELHGQTDRGVAIVGAAWVEEGLAVALESALHHEKKAWGRLFGGNGPLNTFASKIDLAHILGMLSDAIYSDLHMMRLLRNEFAHLIAHETEHTTLSFSSSHIKDRCLALKCIAHEGHTEPRAAFVSACVTLYYDFELLVSFGQKVGDIGQVLTHNESAA